MVLPIDPRRRRGWERLALAGGLGLCFCAPALGQGPGNQAVPVESQVKEFRLANGLLFLVVERHFTPIFSYVNLVDAGGVDTPTGKSGIAHMMEHMAFKGTPQVGTTDPKAEAEALRRVDEAWDAVVEQKNLAVFHRADSTRMAEAEIRFKAAQDEAARFVVSNAFSKLLEANGVQNLNAGTSEDQTAYYYNLPSNKLELWAALEGGRMTYPVFREFYKERDVVIEERRIGTESSPRGRLQDATWETAFTAHPYHHSIIGYRSDLESFSRRDAEQFFREHYNAANMCIAVVGDVRTDEVRRLAERYFSDLPSGPKNPPILTVEPPPVAERMVRTREQAQPLCIVGYYGGPAFTDPAFLAVDALMDILGSGRSSRLYTVLVKERRLAASFFARAGFPGRKYANQVWFNLVPAPGVPPDTLAEALQIELERVATQPITPGELAGYRSRYRAGFVRGLHTNDGLAYQLAYYQTRTGDWRNLFRWMERIDELTPEQINSEAARIFRRVNRTVGIMESVSSGGAEGGKP